jgi:hypothetical protein
MTQQFREQHLIIDEDLSHYDGTTAVVRTKHVPATEVEFLRWRAERWMKVRHMPAAFLHSPSFVLRHSPAMMAHTFAGTSFDRCSAWNVSGWSSNAIKRPGGASAGSVADSGGR